MSENICLKWKDINYSIRKKEFNWKKLKFVEKNVQILKNISGFIQSGSLVAILGASGAGKTSLLAVISQRLRNGYSGDILINDHKISRSQMIRLSSFVPQFDITIDVLTAREHLNFTCELRLGKMLSKESRMIRISDSMIKLGMHHILDTKICHLSGGERKKLNLVTELLTDPKIIFCDEPTTGLDSFSALSVIKSLRFLTQQEMKSFDLSSFSTSLEPHDRKPLLTPDFFNVNFRKAVICSIHQPNSDVFHCFTHVILMRAGRIAFHGTSQAAMEYFSSLGFTCPPSYNPAEFYVKLLAENTVIQNEINEKKDGEKIKIVSNKISTLNEHDNQINFQVGWFTQVYLLLKIFALEARRNMKDFFSKYTPRMLLGLVIALVYGAVKVTDPTSVQSIQGFLFNVMADIMFGATFSTMYFYPSKLPIMRREVGEHFYFLSAYYVSNLLSYIPKCFFMCFVYLSIAYPLVGFSRDIWLYLKLGFTLTLSSIAATAEGIMLSCITGSATVAPEIAPPLHTICMIVAGIYIMVDYYPRLKLFSIYFYTMEALSILFWNEVDFIDCPTDSVTFCPNNGTQVLLSYSYGTIETIWIDYVGLIVLTLIMHIIGFIFVRRLIKNGGYF